MPALPALRYDNKSCFRYAPYKYTSTVLTKRGINYMVRKKNAIVNAAMDKLNGPVQPLNDPRDSVWLNSFNAETDPERAMRRGYWQRIDGHVDREHQAYAQARQEIAVEFDHAVPTPCTGLGWSCSLYCHETCQKSMLQPMGLCLDRYRGLVEYPMCKRQYENVRECEGELAATAVRYVEEIIKFHTCLREVDVPPGMVPAALANGAVRRIVVSALGLPKQVPLFAQSPFIEPVDFSTWSVVDAANGHTNGQGERPRPSEADLCAAAVSALNSVRAAKTNGADIVVALNLVPRRVSYGDRRGPGDMALQAGANVIVDFGGHEDSDRVLQFIATAPEHLFPRRRVSFVRYLFLTMSQALEGRWMRFFLNMHGKPLDVYVFEDEVHAGVSSHVKDLCDEFHSFCHHHTHRLHFVDAVKPDAVVGTFLDTVTPQHAADFVSVDMTSLELTFDATHDAHADVRREVQTVSLEGTFQKPGLDKKVTFKTTGPQEVMSTYDFEMWCNAVMDSGRGIKHLVVKHCYHPDFILELWRLLKHMGTVEHLTLVFHEWSGVVAWEAEVQKAFAGGLLLESLTCVDVVFESDAAKTDSEGDANLFVLWDAMLHVCPRLTCLGTNLYLSANVDISMCGLLQSMPRPYRCDCVHANRLLGRTYFKYEQFMYQCEWVQQDAVYGGLYTPNQLSVLEKVSLFPISNDTVDPEKGVAADDEPSHSSPKFPLYRRKNKIAAPSLVTTTTTPPAVTELSESHVSFKYYEGHCEKDCDDATWLGVYH